MKEIAISEFKVKCLALLEEVRQTKKPLRVTRFGKPVAEIVPPSPDAGRRTKKLDRLHEGHSVLGPRRLLGVLLIGGDDLS
jgi:prevent-host-death family protein